MEGEIQRCCIAQDEETINVVTQKWNDEPENEQNLPPLSQVLVPIVWNLTPFVF